MISSLSVVKCEYPGCSVYFGRNPRRKYCEKHSLLLLEASKERSSQQQATPLPTPPPKPPSTPSPAPVSTGGSGGASPSVDSTPRRSKSRHKQHLDMAKRRFAKRAKPDSEEPQK